jgi:hypothetical protein
MRLAAIILATSALLAVSTTAAYAHGDEHAGGTAPKHDPIYDLEVQAIGPDHARAHAEERAIKARLRTAAGRRSVLREVRREQRKLAAKGPKARRAAALPATPAASGRWADPFSLQVFAINAILLPTGKVLMFAYPFQDEGGERNLTRNWAQAWLWNPALGTGAGAFARVDPPIDPRTGQPANLWCGGASLLSNGTVLVTGGNLEYANGVTYYRGLNHVYTFNPFNETWHRQPNMRHGRWYPTQTLLPNGDTLITSGLSEDGGTPTTGDTNKDIEVFHPPADLDGVGTIELMGARVPEGQTATAGVTSPPDGGLYPHTFLMPSGNVLFLGPFSGDGMSDRWYLNAPFKDIRSWRPIPGDPQDTWATGSRYAGNAVLLPAPAGVASTRVMNLAGGSAVATSSIWDEATGTWTASGPLNIGRAHANTVLLPDASMAEVGGGLGDGALSQWTTEPRQRRIEIWDPGTETWGLGPAQQEARAYHSTALMLPDGSVLSAGDDVNPYFTQSNADGSAWTGGQTDAGVRGDTGEIYYPKYFFNPDGSLAARPTISSAPSGVLYGQQFTVGASGDATRAVLMAPSAVTHANDMSQRRVELTATPGGNGTLTVTSPASGNVAPPGYYMLTVLNGQGVPSLTRWIKVGTLDAQPLPVAPAAPIAPPVARTPRPAPKPPSKALFTSSVAKTWAGKALSRKYRTYRLSKSRTLSCTVKGSRATCTARWSYRGKRYKSAVRVTRTSAKKYTANIPKR